MQGTSQILRRPAAFCAGGRALGRATNAFCNNQENLAALFAQPQLQYSRRLFHQLPRYDAQRYDGTVTRLSFTRSRSFIQPKQLHTLSFPSSLKMEPDVHDILETLKNCHLRTWGFVIYRCTYKSDEDWAAFMREWKKQTEEVFSKWGDGADELLSRLRWTVLEDRQRFDNASPTDIRRAFQQWVDQAPNESEDALAWMDPKTSIFPKYEYCVQIDEDALQSVVGNDSQLPGYRLKTYVKVIKRRWPDFDFWPSEDQQRYLDEVAEERKEMEEEGHVWQDDDEFSEIEGCTDKDVGFMNLSLYHIYPSIFHSLRNNSMWETLYVRPPGLGPF